MKRDQRKSIYSQHTLRKAVTYIGVGLHSGQQVAITVHPAAANSGINFVRRDLPVGENVVPARWYLVSSTDLSTTLANEHGVTVATVEHLLAALRGCGIDNALVDLDGPEVPIMDGSAEPFVQMIEHVGAIAQDARRHVIWINRPVEVHDAGKLAVLVPGNSSRITVSIDFASEAVGAQTYSIELGEGGFSRELAAARTFGFKSDIDGLKARGLARGGSLRNAILIDGNRVVNTEGLRYDDEFARHKALDCVGDLSLAGVPIMGHFYGFRTGHALNQALLAALFTQRDTWSYLPMADFDQLWAGHDGGVRTSAPLGESGKQAGRTRQIRCVHGQLRASSGDALHHR